MYALQMAALAGTPIAFATGVLRGGLARTGEIEELRAWLGSTGWPAAGSRLGSSSMISTGARIAGERRDTGMAL